jgi:DNA polymerase III, beta subunit
MKLQFQREVILKPLQLVMGVVERHQTLPILANLLMIADAQGLSFTATDLEVELVARILLTPEHEGEITLPARKFMDICRALPDSAVIDLSVESERAKLSSGRSRFNLTTLPATEFPSVGAIDSQLSFEISQQELNELLARTHFCMAQQDVRYYLNGLMLEIGAGVLRSVATDGHRLAYCEIDASVTVDELHQIIIPRKGVQELLKLLTDKEDPVRVDIGAKHIQIQLPSPEERENFEGPYIRFTSKLVDGRFPDYQRVIPIGSDKRLVADRERLRQALIRTSILSNEKYRGIRLQLVGDTLRIQAHNPEQEEAEEELEVEYTGEPLEIGFNVNYLLDAMAALQSCSVQVSLSDSGSSCLIESAATKGSATLDAEKARYVVMPMRL